MSKNHLSPLSEQCGESEMRKAQKRPGYNEVPTLLQALMSLSKPVQRIASSEIQHAHSCFISSIRTLQLHLCESRVGEGMNQLNGLERVAAGLQAGRCVFQSRQRQVIGGAQVVLVAVLMDGAIGAKASRALPSLGVAVGMEAPGLPDEAERGQGSQPVKPLRQVGSKGQGPLARANQHVVTLDPVFDQRGDPRPSVPFRGQKALTKRRDALSLMQEWEKGAEESLGCTGAPSMRRRCRSRATSSTRAVTCSCRVITERCK